jgi:hypothetical protein
MAPQLDAQTTILLSLVTLAPQHQSTWLPFVRSTPSLTQIAPTSGLVMPTALLPLLSERLVCLLHMFDLLMVLFTSHAERRSVLAQFASLLYIHI